MPIIQVTGFDRTQNKQVYDQLCLYNQSLKTKFTLLPNFDILIKSNHIDKDPPTEINIIFLCVDPGNLKNLQELDWAINLLKKTNSDAILYLLLTNIQIVANLTVPHNDRQTFFKNTSTLLTIAHQHPHISGCSPIDETDDSLQSIKGIIATLLDDKVSSKPTAASYVTFSESINGNPALIQPYSEDGEFAIVMATNRKRYNIYLPPTPPYSPELFHPISPPPSLRDNVPEEFFCPISRKVMSDPVTASDMKTYDRAALRGWMVQSPCTSPTTGEFMLESDVVPNEMLRQKISAWVAKQKQLANESEHPSTYTAPLTF